MKHEMKNYKDAWDTLTDCWTDDKNIYLNDEYRDSDPYNWGRVAVDFGFQSIVATLKRRCVGDVL